MKVCNKKLTLNIWNPQGGVLLGPCDPRSSSYEIHSLTFRTMLSANYSKYTIQPTPLYNMYYDFI